MLLEAADVARRGGVTLRISPLSRSVSMSLRAAGAWERIGR